MCVSITPGTDYLTLLELTFDIAEVVLLQECRMGESANAHNVFG